MEANICERIGVCKVDMDGNTFGIGKYPCCGRDIEDKQEASFMEHTDIFCGSISIKNENCSGKAHQRYSDIFIFVPEMRQIIRIAEGSGDNLLWEDIENGYVDYIYYDQYELGADVMEIDGGQILLKEMLRDKYRCMADCISDVLDMAYCYPVGFIILV